MLYTAPENLHSGRDAHTSGKVLQLPLFQSCLTSPQSQLVWVLVRCWLRFWCWCWCWCSCGAGAGAGAPS